MTRETFEKLLAPRLNGLRALVRRRMSGFGEAEDVLQEVLLRAYSRRHQLRSEDKFGTWLWSIALNEVSAFHRRNRAMLPIDWLPHFDIRDSSSSPADLAERAETGRWVHACIAELPEREQVAIRARDLEEKSFRDAAAGLGRTVAGTRTTHFRARRRLSRIMRSDAGRASSLAA